MITDDDDDDNTFFETFFYFHFLIIFACCIFASTEKQNAQSLVYYTRTLFMQWSSGFSSKSTGSKHDFGLNFSLILLFIFSRLHKLKKSTEYNILYNFKTFFREKNVCITQFIRVRNTEAQCSVQVCFCSQVHIFNNFCYFCRCVLNDFRMHVYLQNNICT